MIYRLLLMCLFSAGIVPIYCVENAVENATRPDVTPLEQILKEQQSWTFEPPFGRQDIFYDLGEIIEAKKITNAESNAGEEINGQRKTSGKEQDRDKVIEGVRRELERVENFVLARKWEDAIKVCDSSIRSMARFSDDAEIATIVERLKRYRGQAEDAKIYEEAQAKFDALNLKIEGILWSPNGSMAIIGGELRAQKLNDRVKDCVIINIDTNRVDFLFHFNRKRFEFQRYVGEDVKAGNTKSSSGNR